MGTGSDWHWALECSPLFINHNQSSAITSIFFGQLLRRSGGAASLGSLWYVGTAETSGAAMPRKENKNKQQKKKKPSAPESLQASHYKRWGFSNYLQAVLCAACKYKQEGKYTCTRWNLQPFPICENEIQVHKDNTQLWLQPAPV